MATWNGAPTLPKVLDAYCRLSAPGGGWSLLIVDDGSDDSTREVVAGYAARLPLRLVSQARRGKNAALNLGLQLALADGGAELFLFTDDDASPEPDWLLRIDACARAHTECALFGGAIVADWSEPPPPWVLRLVPLGVTYAITDAPDGPVFPGLVWGANMALRREVFEAGYRFDVAVGPKLGAYAMGSETELNRRLGAAGYTAWFCNGARVGHFIRTRQVRPRYILQRAYRFGRGDQLQQAPDNAPRLFGAPRWMLAKLARELAGAVRALAARDWEALFLRGWEIQYLRGFLFQAWFGRGRRLTRGARVLVTSRSGQLGGMELRMAQEARLLAAAGCHASVAMPRFAGSEQLAASLRADGIAFSVFDPPPLFEQWEWRRANRLRARLLAARRLRRYRADLVHVAFCWTSYGGTLLWLANHCRLPAVVSIHNAFPPVRFSPWHIPLYAQAFGAVRGVYAVSPSAMAHFMAIFSRFVPPGARLSVIPNGVDPERFRPSPERRAIARARLGLAPDGLVIGAVARLAPQKRPEALLELFRALRNRHPALTLVLAGSGPLEAVLRAKVELLGLRDHVLFAGQVEAVEELMPAFDLHLLLSRNEGFGIATIEAMACGVAAVGTDVPGTADILRGSEGGLLVPLDDQRATIEAVSALLDDAPRRAAMGVQGRAEVEAHYTLAIMERRVRAFYSGLLP